MDLSPHNIQRIAEWIQSEVDYNFLNPGYTIAFKDEQVVLQQSEKELKQVCPCCLLVPQYLLFFKCGHITCLPIFEKCRRHIFTFEINVFCPICKQSCRLNEIYTYKVKQKKRFDSISMRMFKQAKFICFYKKCRNLYLLETFHHNEMFE